MPLLTRRQVHYLDHSYPAAHKAKLAANVFELQTNFNALLTKLDANHAAATDHSATLAIKPGSTLNDG